MIKKNDAKKLLKDILSIPSVNGRDDEGEVAEYLKRYFTKHNIKTEVQRIDDKHANIIANIKGSDSSRHILFNGHMDTVPYGELNEWRTDPSKAVEKDGFIYARGASDMKSGLAAIVYSIVALSKDGEIPACDITFIGTCDEEKGGLGAGAIINGDCLNNISEIIIGEPTGLNIGIAQKGCLWLSYTVRGKTSHGAYPENGVNAVELGYRIAEEIKKFVSEMKHPLLGKATAQITQISGGVAPNMTPDICNVIMDIRLIPGSYKKDIIDKLEIIRQSIIKENDKKADFNYSFINERTPVEIDSKDSFVEKFKITIEKEGIDPEYIGINYFTDASVFLKKKNMKILLFGPGEPQLCHQANENIELNKYYKSIEILMSYIKMNI